MELFDVTVHMIVKNEDRFVGFALASVLPYVTNAIIYDTGSTDETVKNIHKEVSRASKNNPTLEVTFEVIPIQNANDINKLRLKQVKDTKTDWFIIVDGDEIWPYKQLNTILQITKEEHAYLLAVVNRVRESVGDLWHYLPEAFGKYELLGRKGHLNIRLMRKMNYTIGGLYPNECYMIGKNCINTLNDRLLFSNAWYLHATHLIRSSKNGKAFGRRQNIISKGLRLERNELPEVFNEDGGVCEKRSMYFELCAYIYDLLRKVKYKIS